jgi:uncharacterized membrane protein
MSALTVWKSETTDGAQDALEALAGLLSSDAVMDRVTDRFQNSHAELISTKLTREQEAKPREAVSEDE